MEPNAGEIKEAMEHSDESFCNIDLYIDLEKIGTPAAHDSLQFEASNIVPLKDESEDKSNLGGLDLYSDILTSELQEKQQQAEKAFEELQKLKAEHERLKEQLKVANSSVEKLNRQNTILKYNISSLYKTAKAEVERKDLNIHQLRERLDNIIFRRHRRRQLNYHKLPDWLERYRSTFDHSKNESYKKSSCNDLGNENGKETSSGMDNKQGSNVQCRNQKKDSIKTGSSHRNKTVHSGMKTDAKTLKSGSERSHSTRQVDDADRTKPKSNERKEKHSNTKHIIREMSAKPTGRAFIAKHTARDVDSSLKCRRKGNDCVKRKQHCNLSSLRCNSKRKDEVRIARGKHILHNSKENVRKSKNHKEENGHQSKNHKMECGNLKSSSKKHNKIDKFVDVKKDSKLKDSAVKQSCPDITSNSEKNKALYQQLEDNMKDSNSSELKNLVENTVIMEEDILSEHEDIRWQMHSEENDMKRSVSTADNGEYNDLNINFEETNDIYKEKAITMPALDDSKSHSDDFQTLGKDTEGSHVLENDTKKAIDSGEDVSYSSKGLQLNIYTKENGVKGLSNGAEQQRESKSLEAYSNKNNSIDKVNGLKDITLLELGEIKESCKNMKDVTVSSKAEEKNINHNKYKKQSGREKTTDLCEDAREIVYTGKESDTIQPGKFSEEQKTEFGSLNTEAKKTNKIEQLTDITSKLKESIKNIEGKTDTKRSSKEGKEKENDPINNTEKVRYTEKSKVEQECIMKLNKYTKEKRMTSKHIEKYRKESSSSKLYSRKQHSNVSEWTNIAGKSDRHREENCVKKFDKLLHSKSKNENDKIGKNTIKNKRKCDTKDDYKHNSKRKCQRKENIEPVLEEKFMTSNKEQHLNRSNSNTPRHKSEEDYNLLITSDRVERSFCSHYKDNIDSRHRRMHHEDILCAKKQHIANQRHKKKYEREKHRNEIRHHTKLSSPENRTEIKKTEGSKPKEIMKSEKTEPKYRSEGELSTSDSEG